MKYTLRVTSRNFNPMRTSALFMFILALKEICSLSTAIVISLIWGLSILSLLSYSIAKSQSEPAWKIVGEHLMIAIVVIGITQWVGSWVGKLNA